MKERTINFLKHLDCFGAPMFQHINRTQSLYRSLIGGLSTFLIFSTSIAYSIVVLYQWQNNELSPKIQQSSYVSDYQLLDINYDVLTFSYWKPEVEFIDPFEANILIPIVTYTKNYTFTDSVVLRLSNRTAYDGNKYIIPKMKLGFTSIEGDIFTTSEMYIQFVKCQQSLLTEDEQCASEEIIQQFYSQPLNTIVMQIHYKSLDSKDKLMKTSAQSILIQLETNQCYTLNTYLKSTTYEINDSFLFGQSDKYEYINGALVQTQSNSVNYCQQAFGYETYVLVYVIMSGNQTKSIYDYPHASDLLANIGSIISILFMVKYLILFLNNNSLQQSVINELFQLYYPQYCNFKIQKNWIGKIKRIYYNSRQLNDDEKKSFIEVSEKITAQVKLKLSIVNLLYEVSRLYLLVRSIKSFEEIKKVHLIGIRFDFIKQDKIMDSELRRSSRDYSRQQFLSNDDMSALSLDERLEVLKDDKVSNELESIINDYYDINRIM